MLLVSFTSRRFLTGVALPLVYLPTGQVVYHERCFYVSLVHQILSLMRGDELADARKVNATVADILHPDVSRGHVLKLRRRPRQ